MTQDLETLTVHYLPSACSLKNSKFEIKKIEQTISNPYEWGWGGGFVCKYFNIHTTELKHLQMDLLKYSILTSWKLWEIDIGGSWAVVVSNCLAIIDHNNNGELEGDTASQIKYNIYRFYHFLKMPIQ